MDTCVFGGAFEPEFRAGTLSFLQQVRERKLTLIISSVVEGELLLAPPRVQQLVAELGPLVHHVAPTAEVDDLQQAYLAAGVVSPNWETDAYHVAIATVCGCNAIVSWNFKHLVNMRRIALYNAVNVSEGYPAIAIHSPNEVIFNED